MPPGTYQAEPPEVTSAEFWLGPSAASFFSSAAQLEALSALIIEQLGGHAAVEAAMRVNWPAPTGELAVLANVPHMLWMATSAMQLMANAGKIAATGQAFEDFRAATPTPGEVTENQSEHIALNASNFLGMLTPWIVLNRQLYGTMWVRGVSSKYGYAAASGAGAQSLLPLAPPPPTATPISGAAPSDMPGGETSADLLSSAAGGPMESLMGFMPMAMQLPSMAGQMLSGGGPLKSLTEVPQQALQQLSSLSSQFGSLDAGADLFGAGGAEWVTATPQAGGPAAANLVGAGGGGGGVGGGGFGATSPVSAALRSPLSWSSAVNAAQPSAGADAAAMSRFAEARGSTTAPASATGTGGGGMMAPMAHGAAAGANDSEKRPQGADSGQVLASAADFYRAPDGLPTITGAGGAQLLSKHKEGD